MESEVDLGKESGLKAGRAIWTAVLAGIVLLLALYNLKYFPPTGFDEGSHLLVARTLAVEGEYRFGPAVGPTVLVPVAAVFRLAGVGLLPARMAMAVYLLLSIAAFYALAHRLGGWKVATVGTLLLLSSPGVNLLRWGRQALGEVPATLFFLVGALLWSGGLGEERRAYRRGRLVLSGLFLGLAVITKNQFLLLLPAWVLLWLADRLYYRQATHSDFILPLVVVMACVTGWYVGQRFLFASGRQLSSRNVEAWSSALSRGMLTFSPGRTLDAVRFLADKDTFFGWVLPGWLYALMLSLRRNREGMRWPLLVWVTTVWFGWFLLLSVGWPRYAFLPLAVSAIFIAQLFHDLTDGYRFPLRPLLQRIRVGQFDLASAGKIGLVALLAVILLRSLQGRLIDVVVVREDSPLRMAAYIVEEVPSGAEIETYEPEICFLSGYDCHFPPSGTLDTAIKYVWYGAPPPSEFYDFREYGAPYLLIGDFGRWVHLYDPESVERDYELIASVGDYKLYRARW
jgi:hypothetical protein